MQILLNRRKLIAGSGGKYIKFKDPVVEAICVANWSSDGIGLTLEDAARVTSIPVGKFSGTSIESFDEFKYFVNCTKINGSNQENAGFRGCTSLKSITFPPSLTTFYGNCVFQGCTALVRVSGFKVTHMGNSSFKGCSSLVDIDLSSIISVGDESFHGTSLSGLRLSLPSLTKASLDGTFYGTSIIEILNLGSVKQLLHGAYGLGCFGSCTRLTKAMLPATLTRVGRNCFSNCSSLTEVTLPGSSVCELYETNAFSGCTSLAHIYVPAALVEDYKTANNWSTYASKIEALPSN